MRPLPNGRPPLLSGCLLGPEGHAVIDQREGKENWCCVHRVSLGIGTLVRCDGWNHAASHHGLRAAHPLEVERVPQIARHAPVAEERYDVGPYATQRDEAAASRGLRALCRGLGRSLDHDWSLPDIYINTARRFDSAGNARLARHRRFCSVRRCGRLCPMRDALPAVEPGDWAVVHVGGETMFAYEVDFARIRPSSNEIEAAIADGVAQAAARGRQ